MLQFFKIKQNVNSVNFNLCLKVHFIIMEINWVTWEAPSKYAHAPSLFILLWGITLGYFEPTTCLKCCMIVKLYSQRPSPIPLLLLIPRILGSLNVKLEGMELSTHLLIILLFHMLELYLLHHDLIHAPLGFSCKPFGEGSFSSSLASYKGTGSTISSPCPRFLSTCVFPTLGIGKPS